VNPRRLYRSNSDRRLAGVAAGVAEYLDLDPTLVRVLWVVSVFFGGFTLLLYIVMAFIVPVEPAAMHGPGSWQPTGPVWGPPPTGPAWGVPPVQAAGTDTAGEAAEGAQVTGDGAPMGGGTAPYGWPAPDRRPVTHGGGRGALYLGVLLVIFGAIAMAETMIPGWVGFAHLGPALIVAVGVLLLVGSIRRGAYEP
jgi:phage shock protein C